MATKRSAGLLLYRTSGDHPEVLLGHMGGPLWARRDAGAWSVPKGEYEDTEEPLAAARREFAEELGLPPPEGSPVELGEVRQGSGKLVRVWALAGDLDPGAVVPGTFELEWPPRSGQVRSFPEVDRVGWFGIGTAREKIVAAQRPFLDRLVRVLDSGFTPQA